MAIERTLSIVKPDAVAKNHIGDIFARFEKAGLQIVATKMKHLTQTEAEGFYAELLFQFLKVKTQFLLTAKSLAQLTLKKRLQALSALTSL